MMPLYFYGRWFMGTLCMVCGVLTICTRASAHRCTLATASDMLHARV